MLAIADVPIDLQDAAGLAARILKQNLMAVHGHFPAIPVGVHQFTVPPVLAAEYVVHPRTETGETVCRKSWIT